MRLGRRKSGEKEISLTLPHTPTPYCVPSTRHFWWWLVGGRLRHVWWAVEVSPMEEKACHACCLLHCMPAAMPDRGPAERETSCPALTPSVSLFSTLSPTYHHTTPHLFPSHPHPSPLLLCPSLPRPSSHHLPPPLSSPLRYNQHILRLFFFA